MKRFITQGVIMALAVLAIGGSFIAVNLNKDEVVQEVTDPNALSAARRVLDSAQLSTSTATSGYILSTNGTWSEWIANTGGGGGGGGSLFTADTINNVIYPSLTGTTTSTTTIKAHAFIASSTVASIFPYASSTAITATNFWGLSSLATALNANGANCSAGNSPLGVDASGAVESCFDVWTEAENTSAGYTSNTGDITTVGSCTGSDCFTAASTDESLWFTGIAAPSHSEGQFFYNSDLKTFSFFNDEPEVQIDIGRESLVFVRNSTGSTINIGTPVYLTGATGNKPNVAPARANADAGGGDVVAVGVTTHDIENNSNGYMMTHGVITGIDTSDHSAGAELFLGTTTAGTLISSLPLSPDWVVPIGYVLTSNPSNGSILVDFHSWYDTIDLTAENRDQTITADWDFTGEVTMTTATTTNASSTNLSVATRFDLLGDIITNVGTWFLTKINAITGAVDWGGITSFEIPNAANPTVNATGEIALETATNTLRYYDGSEERVVYPFDIFSFNLASTTQVIAGQVTYSAGTTTFPVRTYRESVTVDNLYCKTDVGTVNVQIGDGSASSTITAVGTAGSNLDPSSNNTFLKREEILVSVGTSVSSADNLFCELEVKLTAL